MKLINYGREELQLINAMLVTQSAWYLLFSLSNVSSGPGPRYLPAFLSPAADGALYCTIISATLQSYCSIQDLLRPGHCSISPSDGM